MSEQEIVERKIAQLQHEIDNAKNMIKESDEYYKSVQNAATIKFIYCSLASLLLGVAIGLTLAGWLQ